MCVDLFDFSKKKDPKKMMHHQLQCCLLSWLLLQARADLTVTSNLLTIIIDSTTGFVASAHATNGWNANLSGTTTSIGHGIVALSSKVQPCGEGVCVVRHVSTITETSDSTGRVSRNLTLLDEYHPVMSDKSTSVIQWKTTVIEPSEKNHSPPSYWRSDWIWNLRLARPRKWWLPSTGPVGDTHPRFDALQSRPFDNVNNTTCVYGGMSFFSHNVSKNTESCPVPLSVHGQDDLGALGLVLSLNDTVLSLRATQAGPTSITWTRKFDRQGGGESRTWRGYFVYSTAAKTAFRSVLGFVRDTFPSLFRSNADDFRQLGGMGAYSCANVGDGMKGRSGKVTPSVLWDAHFWWPYAFFFLSFFFVSLLIRFRPNAALTHVIFCIFFFSFWFHRYQGMFWPPSTADWQSNVGNGEQGACGTSSSSFRHGEHVTEEEIRAEYRAAKEANTTMLNYFNFDFFGQNVNLSPLSTLLQAAPWQNSSEWLLSHFADAVVPGPVYDWQRSVMMDTSVASWTDWLVGQVNATRNRLVSYFRLVLFVLLDQNQ